MDLVQFSASAPERLSFTAKVLKLECKLERLNNVSWNSNLCQQLCMAERNSVRNEQQRGNNRTRSLSEEPEKLGNVQLDDSNEA